MRQTSLAFITAASISVGIMMMFTHSLFFGGVLMLIGLGVLFTATKCYG